MAAIADERALYLLEFEDKRGLHKKSAMLKKELGCEIVSGRTAITERLEDELTRYFAGNFNAFKTPLFMWGTPFQNMVWDALRKIPTGKTQSYQDVAINIGKKSAFRAVANANGANRYSIIIPCHRVINSDGGLGGYGGGIERKRWLLAHEKRFLSI